MRLSKLEFHAIAISKFWEFPSLTTVLAKNSIHQFWGVSLILKDLQIILQTGRTGKAMKEKARQGKEDIISWYKNIISDNVRSKRPFTVHGSFFPKSHRCQPHLALVGVLWQELNAILPDSEVECHVSSGYELVIHCRDRLLFLMLILNRLLYNLRLKTNVCLRLPGERSKGYKKGGNWKHDGHEPCSTSYGSPPSASCDGPTCIETPPCQAGRVESLNISKQSIICLIFGL